MVAIYSQNLLDALGERRKQSGQDVYFIQVSQTWHYNPHSLTVRYRLEF